MGNWAPYGYKGKLRPISLKALRWALASGMAAVIRAQKSAE